MTALLSGRTKEPDRHTRRKLADALGVGLDALITEEADYAPRQILLRVALAEEVYDRLMVIAAAARLPVQDLVAAWIEDRIHTYPADTEALDGAVEAVVGLRTPPESQ